MNNLLRYIAIGLLFVLLILVRAFASEMFYDPFVEYFKNNYLHQGFPEINTGKLFSSLFFRYLLNTLISLGIIYLFFKNKQFFKFTIWFYAIAFVVLSLLLFLLLKTTIVSSHLPLFYTRRFLIHPIFVLILIPAFYYQNNFKN